MTTAGLLVLTTLLTSAGGSGADEHLLVGARAFREARYDEALVEFRVAQALGAADAAPYAAASLVKLGRAEEAVEAFGPGELPGRDALMDYYRALACYGARLYLCADRLLAAVGDRSGPRIGEQAARIRAAIAGELAKEPSAEAIAWYRSRCAQARTAGRTALATAYCGEATALAARRAPPADRSDAGARLSGAGRAAANEGAR